MSSSIEEIASRMRALGAHSVLAKALAPNDNSKNQIYLASDPAALSVLPSAPFVADDKNPGIVKAALEFFWLLDDNSTERAPDAQLIFYPQYPEVRLSGILKRTAHAPNHVIRSRDANRFIVVGALSNGSLLAAAGYGASQVASLQFEGTDSGVLRQIKIHQKANSRILLIRELARIHNAGWLPSEQLSSDGTPTPCGGPRCVGLTLESQLGIPQNGICGPDFLDWEIKAMTTNDYARIPPSKAVTLITPAPSGGFYREGGPAEFVRRYGYAAKSGEPDRLNFGGRFFFGREEPTTKLTLTMSGYNAVKADFPNGGGIQLVDRDGHVAAEWDFAALATKWKEKHSHACYVPAEKSDSGGVTAFRYGRVVRLAREPVLGYLLRSIVDGSVYFDPGIKLTNAKSPTAKPKERHQFRIASENISRLYMYFEEIDVVRAHANSA